MDNKSFYSLEDLQYTPRTRRVRQPQNRRETLQKKLSFVTVAVLSVFLVLVALFLLVFPRSEVSVLEKRELAKFPAFSIEDYFSGKFTAGIATFYDDAVPYRDEFTKMGTQLKSLFGVSGGENDVEFVNGPAVVKPNAPTTDSSGTVTPTAAPTPTPAPNVLEEGEAGRVPLVTPEPSPEPDQRDYTQEEADVNVENGIVIVNQDGHYRALELFGGGGGSTYASALNRLHSTLGSTVRIYSMPCPLASEFYTPINYSDYTVSQSDCFDLVHEKLDSGIVTINVCDVLKKHTEEPIYCRTDHHWQALGAYYATRTFAEVAEVPFADLSTYEKAVVNGYVGSMYAFSGSAKLLNDPEDFVYYKPDPNSYTTSYYDQSFSYLWGGDTVLQEGFAGTSDSYMINIGGDGYIVKVDSAVKNGRKLLVVKDSYGNAEIPFLTGSFEQIYVVDMRYMERNMVSLIQDMGITDVLFTMSSYSLVGGNSYKLDTMIDQRAGETIVDSNPVVFPTPKPTATATPAPTAAAGE